MTVLRALLLGMLLSFNASAQTYPARPVTFIVPWPPGGSTDLAMRALAAIAEKHLGQRIVIENRPGVSGTQGAAHLAQNARPDGYTVSQMPITVFRLPHMTKMAFDPMADFTWIIHLTGYTFGVVVLADSTGWAEQVNSGRLRLLSTWGNQRTKRWPNAPTLKDLGYPIVSNSPYGLAGPKGMDPAVVKVLHDAFRKALEDPEYQKTLEKFDQEMFYLGSDDYAALAKKTFEEEREAVKRLNLKM